MNNKKKNSSQRKVSMELGISRTTLRKGLNLDDSIKLSSLKTIATYFDQEITILSHPKNSTPICTTVATSFYIHSDGFDSWKIHLMNMVDEFRKSKDQRLIILPPDNICSTKLTTLIAATVLELCIEEKISQPSWAKKIRPLSRPWFVSGMESLKASALLESPHSFRSKNIFVHDNFLQRV